MKERYWYNRIERYGNRFKCILFLKKILKKKDRYLINPLNIKNILFIISVNEYKNVSIQKNWMTKTLGLKKTNKQKTKLIAAD